MTCYDTIRSTLHQKKDEPKQRKKIKNHNHQQQKAKIEVEVFKAQEQSFFMKNVFYSKRLNLCNSKRIR